LLFNYKQWWALSTAIFFGSQQLFIVEAVIARPTGDSRADSAAIK